MLKSEQGGLEKKIKPTVHLVVWKEFTVKCFMHNAELSQLLILHNE